MKRLLLSLFIVFIFSSVASSQTIYTTRSGYIASVSESMLDKAIGMLDDTQALQSMADSGFIFVLKCGLQGYLVKAQWTGKVKVWLKGTIHEVWTLREAIR